MTAAPTQARRRSRWPAVVACILLSTCTASPALAQDDEEELPDARLTGYADSGGSPMKVELGGGAALNYALAALLAAISVGITFKNANRSHLD